MATISGFTLAKKTPMEDAIQFSENIGVLADGHGSYLGADIAEFACAKVMEALSYNQATLFNQDVSLNPDNFYETMPKLFADIHHEYLQKISKIPSTVVDNDVPTQYGNIVRGGTTLTVMYHGIYEERPYIMTANVGDSDAFIFTVKDGLYNWKQLTTTHEPTSQSEYFRVQKLGQYAAHFMYDTIGSHTVATHLPIFEPDGTMIRYEDTYTPYSNASNEYKKAWDTHNIAKKAGEPFKELRMKLNEEMKKYQMAMLKYRSSPDCRRNIATARGDRAAYMMCDSFNRANNIKIAMTRSIGDYAAHKVGLTHEPAVDITWLELEDVDHAIFFMASDGVLDSYKMDELTKVVMETEPSLLMPKFKAKSIELFHKQHDDMAFILKQLK
jgi:serine/threonine protein phosphatase PrpC